MFVGSIYILWNKIKEKCYELSKKRGPSIAKKGREGKIRRKIIAPKLKKILMPYLEALKSTICTLNRTERKNEQNHR